MFDMDGMELIEKLKHIYPTGIYVLFTSLREENLIKQCAERNIKYLNKAGKCEGIKKLIEEINVNY
jgi:response regulator RpfG family c-di-GMP phosphodiesterase